LIESGLVGLVGVFGVERIDGGEVGFGVWPEILAN